MAVEKEKREKKMLSVFHSLPQNFHEHYYFFIYNFKREWSALFTGIILFSFSFHYKVAALQVKDKRRVRQTNIIAHTEFFIKD